MERWGRAAASDRICWKVAGRERTPEAPAGATRGEAVPVAPRTLGTRRLQQTIEIAPAAGGAVRGETEFVDLAAKYAFDERTNIVVEVEFEDGFVLATTPDRLTARMRRMQEEADATSAEGTRDRGGEPERRAVEFVPRAETAPEGDGAGGRRAADEILLPQNLVRPGTGSRGAVSWAVKAVRYLVLDDGPPPVADLVGEAAVLAIAAAEKALVRPRLAAIGIDGSVLEDTASFDPGPPILVLVHGTMSSTAGSFGALLADARTRARLRQAYGDRICALEHRTLTASPVANALDLVEALPQGATLHVVSHSRGGIVGELVVWATSFAAGATEEAVRDAVPRALADRDDGTVDDLVRLWERARGLRVEKFVRVACPAAGTLLASDRLDDFVSAVFALFKLGIAAFLPATAPAAIAWVAKVQDVVTAILEHRTEPDDLPGIEAQRPESPFAALLNGRREPVDQDLFVVAGDLRTGGLLPSLRALAGYAYFWERNDLIVQTRSMYRGLPRKRRGSAEFEARDVHHFSYFRRSESRDAMLAALTAHPGRWPQFREWTPDDARSPRERGAAATRDAAPPPRAKDVVLLVPDVFTVALRDGDGALLWAEAATVTSQAWRRLGDRDAEFATDGPLDPFQYRGLAAAMPDAAVRFVAYDWRRGVVAAEAAIQGAMDAAAAEPALAKKPVHLVGHGLGALGVARWIHRHVDAWDAAQAAGGRAVLVAPPLEGAHAVLAFALGEGPLASALRCLDGAAGPAAFTALVARWDGVLDLLPDGRAGAACDALDPAWWRFAGGAAPPAKALRDARARRAELTIGKTTSVLFGAAAATPRVVTPGAGAPFVVDDTAGAGDGWTTAPAPDALADAPWSVPPARTWHMRGGHERLLADARRGGVVSALLRGGVPEGASPVRPATVDQRAAPGTVFPDDEDILAAVSGRTPPGAGVPEHSLQVEVVHGDLRFVNLPVIVGHHEQDVLWGAEWVLDRILGGALTVRQGSGYPGAPGSAAYVPDRARTRRSGDGAGPPGALVIGLGRIGELKPATVVAGVRAAAIQWALQVDHDRPAAGGEWVSAAVSAILVGSHFAGLSVRDAVRAVVRGVVEANRELRVRHAGPASTSLWDSVRIDRLQFVERYSDAAGEAVREVRAIAASGDGILRGDERIDCGTRVVGAAGRLGPRPTTGVETAWWRRLVVRELRRRGDVRGLQYTVLGDLARVDDAKVSSSVAMVDDLVRAELAKPTSAAESKVSVALFELLLPNPVKDSVAEGGDLVVVVDRRTGRLPWELLAVRRDGIVEPLVRGTRVIRQFRTAAPRPPARTAPRLTALVLGDPGNAPGFPPLPGARQEAEEVRRVLGDQGFELATDDVRPPYAESISAIFGGDLRVVHIAAHGSFDPTDAAKTGIVLGPGAPLGAGEVRQLRTAPDLVFLNCCHLGRTQGSAAAGTLRSQSLHGAESFAPSVAEALIEIGVRCVVVAGWAVQDDAGRTFARAFYERLCVGDCFGEAVAVARRRVLDAHGTTGNTWGAYQCYGDPEYRLPVRARRRPRDADLPATAEGLRSELERVAAGCALLPRDERGNVTESARDETVERIGRLAAQATGPWAAGAVLEALGHAWRNVGRFEEAIAAYDAAVRATDGGATLVAVEQAANLRSRHATALRDAARRRGRSVTGKASAKIRTLERRAAVQLRRLLRIAPTPERWRLVGSLRKRLATAAADAAERTALLGRAESAYDAAAKLHADQAAGDEDHSSLQNVAAVRWALGDADGAREALARARRSSALVRQDTPWARAAAIDLDVLDELLKDPATRGPAASLADRYVAYVQGADEPTRWSVLDQVGFLRGSARDEASRAWLDDLAAGVAGVAPVAPRPVEAAPERRRTRAAPKPEPRTKPKPKSKPKPRRRNP